MPNTVITNFPITVYGNMEKYSDTISKGRCRVFYKGLNRNGTYITDEFAQKLINSAPYTPVKGIYDFDGEDYTDHGQKRSEGRIYGIVPAEPNFKWEKHLDSSGKEREYACFDVLYYTALYKEAGQLNGKGESMELYRQTLKGDWKIMDGKKVYVFTDGCFLGLQALGDDVEPCFEGASFYSNNGEEGILALLEKYEKRTDLFQNHEQGGNDTMPSIEFKVSDGQKYEFLFYLLNPNFNEAGGWAMEYAICEVYTEYAIARNLSEGIYERIYYTKDDQADSLEITNREKCYIVDVNESEKQALDNLKGESTYEAIAEAVAAKDTALEEKDATICSLQEQNDANEAKIENLNSEISDFSSKIAELTDSISTLEIERDEAKESFTNAQATIASMEATAAENENTISQLVAERDSLATYKKNVEDKAKQAVIAGYVEHLDDEIIESYTKNMDNYTIEELDMKLTYEQKKANPGLFSSAPAAPAYVPKDEDCGRSINDILAKYAKH